MKKAVLISCFDWYEKRLKPIRKLLTENGYQVKVLTSDFDHLKKDKIENKHRECTYLHVPKYRNNISFQRIRSHMTFSKECKQNIEKFVPDLIYCMVPPNRVVDYCSKYKKNHPDIIFVIDIIDLWPESIPLGRVKNLPPSKIWMNWRNKAIKVADFVFTECDLYQKKLNSALIPSKTTTLHLYKEQTDEERELIRKIIDIPKSDDVIRFAYLGSMNNIIDINGICGVIKKFVNGGKKCELHAIGSGVNKESFEAAVAGVGCNTFFYGSIFDEKEKIRILTPCDFALNMMKESVSVGLTIKSIDYLSYGLPLINNIKGDTWDFVNYNRVGINVDFQKNWSISECVDRYKIIALFEDNFSVEGFLETVYVMLRKTDYVIGEE